MQKLTRRDLWSLEEYTEKRNDFRAQVMAHKKNRQLALGDHARLYFEDRLTIHYQIQEMLRIEKVFDPAGIQDELDAYNPLIPDGCNWKATFMVEYDDELERRQRLRELKGVEKALWLQVDGCAPITPIADEDLAREDAEKTSSVHFLRFELSADMRQNLFKGATLQAGIDHQYYSIPGFKVPDNVRQSLLEDLTRLN